MSVLFRQVSSTSDFIISNNPFFLAQLRHMLHPHKNAFIALFPDEVRPTNSTIPENLPPRTNLYVSRQPPALYQDILRVLF